MVLGSRTAEELATEKLITLGLRACRPVNQSRQRPSVPYAPNVAPSTNPAKEVVVVAVVLGSKTVEVLAKHNTVTRGTRASGLAKHG